MISHFRLSREFLDRFIRSSRGVSVILRLHLEVKPCGNFPKLWVMQQLYMARDELDAHFLQGLLNEEGIDSVIQGEAMERVWGGVPVTDQTTPTLWVQEADIERARPIIAEYERRRKNLADHGGAPARPTWTCPKCGEAVEEQFTSCWNCGTARPTADQP